MVMMEDIFRDLHLEEHQSNMASLEAVEGEGVKPGVTIRKSPRIEAIRWRRWRLYEESPTTSAAVGPSFVPNISST